MLHYLDKYVHWVPQASTLWIPEDGLKCQLSFVITLVLLLFPRGVNSFSALMSLPKIEK